VSDVHIFEKENQGKKKSKLARPKAVGLEQNGRSLGTVNILTVGAREENHRRGRYQGVGSS
jgi:hypothetical protein